MEIAFCTFRLLKVLEFASASGNEWHLRDALVEGILEGPQLHLPQIQVLQIQTDIAGLACIAYSASKLPQGPKGWELAVDVKHQTTVEAGVCIHEDFPTPKTWPSIIKRLASLSTKEKPVLLNLTFRIDPPRRYVHVGPQFPDLSALTFLDKLTLSGYSFLNGARDFVALSVMTQMRHLVLDGFEMPAEGASQLLPCLRALPRLVWLVIAEAGMPAEFVGSVLTELLRDRDAVQELAQLGWRIPVPRMELTAIRAFVHAACARPAMRTLVLDTAHAGDRGPLEVILTGIFCFGTPGPRISPPHPAQDHDQQCDQMASLQRQQQSQLLMKDLRAAAVGTKVKIVHAWPSRVPFDGAGQDCYS